MWLRILAEILILLIFTFVLMNATGIVLRGVTGFSKSTRMGKFSVATIILALSTSFPELFVGFTAGLNNTPALSLGNVIGSNIANISLIVGIAAMVGGSVPVLGEYLKKDFFIAFLAGTMPMMLLLDRRLDRVDGLILLMIYGYYLFSVLHKKHAKAVMADKRHVRARFWVRFRLWGHTEGSKAMGMIFLGMGLLLFSADMVVRVGKLLASDLDIPVLLVGLFLVAVGTSLPELAVEIQAVRKKEVALVFGNLLGSTIANSTLIIGITVLLSPMELIARRTYLIATIAYVVVFGMFWLLTKTKRRLDRWEGGILILTYLLFMAVEFIKENGYGTWLPSWIQWLLGR